MSLEEVLKEFIFDCKLRKLSERTIVSYRKGKFRKTGCLCSQAALFRKILQ